MLIVYPTVGTGWQPISYMVSLAVELLEAELLPLDFTSPSRFRKIESLLLRRKKNQGHESCLVICPTPTYLSSLLLVPGWRKRFRFIAAWVIDSFWIDRIPRTTRLSQAFDHFFIMTQEDAPEWNRLTKTPTTCLPWGTDALRLGGNNLERTWDVVRVGRQPPEWEDDFLTEQACLSSHLRFHGRPQLFDDPMKNQVTLMQLYQQTKFALAFSNAVNPTIYTHPLREYVTARWVDALACGAIVAGVPPKGPSGDQMLWDGATLDLGSVSRKDGLQVIKEALSHWKVEQAERNYQQALAKLDWRWRFAKIAEVFQESPKHLSDDFKLLNQKIQQQNHPVKSH